MMPASTRSKPTPAGEPSPTTIDPPPTPVEDLPAGDPPPAPSQPEQIAGVFAGTVEEAAGRFGRLPELGGPGVEYGPDAEPLREDYPLSVWEAVAEVTRQIKAIAKDKRTEGGERYNFRGIDDALEALHPILGDVGLVLLPGEVVERERETRQTAKGGTLNVCHLRVRYTMVGPDGSMMTGEAWGEAGDSGDKATQKAHSQSYKTFVFQTFSIPTRDSARDEPDAVHEESRPFTGDEFDRAARAWTAAQGVETVEALAGVRHRAFALLGVPVRTASGSSAPLAVLIDERRAQIESVPAGAQS